VRTLPGGARRGAAVLVGVVGLLVVAACGAGPSALPGPAVPVTSGPAPTSPPTPGPDPSLGSAPASQSPDVAPPPVVVERPAVRRLVTAGGVTQWLDCAGRGAVTVVVVPGLASSSADWTTVLPGSGT